MRLWSNTFPSFRDWLRHWLSETSHHVVFPPQTCSIPASARESFRSQNTCQKEGKCLKNNAKPRPRLASHKIDCSFFLRVVEDDMSVSKGRVKRSMTSEETNPRHGKVKKKTKKSLVTLGTAENSSGIHMTCDTDCTASSTCQMSHVTCKHV